MSKAKALETIDEWVTFEGGYYAMVEELEQLRREVEEIEEAKCKDCGGGVDKDCDVILCGACAWPDLYRRSIDE